MSVPVPRLSTKPPTAPETCYIKGVVREVRLFTLRGSGLGVPLVGVQTLTTN
jgi:hypothetical protein